MIINRYIIQDAIEEWRDDCADLGIEVFNILYDDNMIKDLARHLLIRIREKEKNNEQE